MPSRTDAFRLPEEVTKRAANAVRTWAFQQEYLARIAADARPFHVQLGKPPSIVFRVTDGSAETIYCVQRREML